MIKLCAPAIIYLIFSLTQILIDTYNGLYNTVAIKSIVTIMITALLHILCEQGLSAVSWIIVFIPFILMTVIVSVLLYAFGLDTATGTIQKGCTKECCKECIDKENKINKYNVKEQVYNVKEEVYNNKNTNSNWIPYWSSSPAYQTH